MLCLPQLPEQEQGILLSNSLGFHETFTSTQATTVETNYDPEHFKCGNLITVQCRQYNKLQMAVGSSSMFVAI